jgi:hypothetical protein
LMGGTVSSRPPHFFVRWGWSMFPFVVGGLIDVDVDTWSCRAPAV